MNVLLVDDEEELVSTLAERLIMRGFDAAWASNCDTALEWLRQQRFDVALLDVKLPNINGLELKKRMNELYPWMKFIFVTGHGSETDFKACSEDSGQEFYLIKPVQIEVLTAKLHEIMQQ